MKFKNARKTLAAILSVLTMMPNCYQLEPEKTKKATQPHHTNAEKTTFLSKNTTMTTGERIVKDIALVLGTLGVGGFIAGKCGKKNDTPSSNTGSPRIEPATVTKKDYGYEIQNNIARVVLFSAKDTTETTHVYMMCQLFRPEVLAYSSPPYRRAPSCNSLATCAVNY